MELSKSQKIGIYRRLYPARYLLCLAKQRAKAMGIPFTITEEDVVIPEYCPALGIKLQTLNHKHQTWNSATLDRLIPEKGYVPGNVKVISSLANQIKNKATYSDIVKVAKWLKGLTKK